MVSNIPIIVSLLTPKLPQSSVNTNGVKIIPSRISKVKQSALVFECTYMVNFQVEKNSGCDKSFIWHSMNHFSIIPIHHPLIRS